MIGGSSTEPTELSGSVDHMAINGRGNVDSVAIDRGLEILDAALTDVTG